MQNPIFAALDTTDLDRAKTLARALKGRVGGLKVGKEFLSAHGPAGVRALGQDLPLFTDVKFHDIPNTVASAIRALAPLQPAIINLHAAGGPAMMRAARQAVDEPDTDGAARPWLIAVTVLTSLDDDDLKAVGQQGPVREQVLRLARLAQDCGLDGVVCSAREIVELRQACGPDFKLVVPGIRPAGSDKGDQKRVMTPKQAKDAGADILVIGRPITAADDPAKAAEAIVAALGPPESKA